MTYKEFLRLNRVEMQKEIEKMKGHPLSPVEMYNAVGLQKELSYRVLRERMGGKSKYCINYAGWKEANKDEDNPTFGFCARMTALFVQKLAGTLEYSLFRIVDDRDTKSPIDHYFVVLEVSGQAEIVDLTCDQIGDVSRRLAFPYERAESVGRAALNHLQAGAGATRFANDFMLFYRAVE